MHLHSWIEHLHSPCDCAFICIWRGSREHLNLPCVDGAFAFENRSIFEVELNEFLSWCICDVCMYVCVEGAVNIGACAFDSFEHVHFNLEHVVGC